LRYVALDCFSSFLFAKKKERQKDIIQLPEPQKEDTNNVCDPQGTALKAGVRFLTFDSIKNSLSDEKGQLTFAQSVFSGMMAGCMESVVALTPTERIKTAMSVIF
jgi:hypothetical protein